MAKAVKCCMCGKCGNICRHDLDEVDRQELALGDLPYPWTRHHVKDQVYDTCGDGCERVFQKHMAYRPTEDDDDATDA